MRPDAYRQIAVTAPQHVELVEKQTRPVEPHEVAGPTLMTLVSAGTELASAYTAQDGFPRFPGYASVFRIEEIGPNTAGFAPGDLALCMGPHAGWQQCAERDIVAVPADIAPAHAVCARMMAVSMSTLTTTAARPPESVAISGLGPVGHFAAQIFQAAGYKTLAVDPIKARRDIASSAGIRLVSETLPTDGDFALIVDCSGHEQAVLDACRCVRKGGEVVLVGVPWKRCTDLHAHDILHVVFHRYVHLRSGWEWEVPYHNEAFRHNSTMGQLEGAVRWIAEGSIKLDGLTTTYSPVDAQAVYEALMKRETPSLLSLFAWGE